MLPEVSGDDPVAIRRLVLNACSVLMLDEMLGNGDWLETMVQWGHRRGAILAALGEVLYEFGFPSVRCEEGDLTEGGLFSFPARIRSYASVVDARLYALCRGHDNGGGPAFEFDPALVGRPFPIPLHAPESNGCGARLLEGFTPIGTPAWKG